MDIRDLIVEVRDVNLNRVGQITAQNLPGLKIVQRFNNVGTWEITLPADDPIADELRAAGAGLIVTGDTGVLVSGFTTSAVKEVTPTDPIGSWTIQGVDDSVILGERLAYPTPGTADVTAQTTESDARSGLASTVMYEYVDVNIGPSAPVDREIPFLTLAADAGVGSTVYKTARFRVLGEVLSEIGSIDPIGFRIVQSGDTLEFSCYEPTDRTGEIRLDVVNDTLSKSTYGYGVPSVTRAIVGGTGQGTSRTFLEVSDSESLAAETLWNRRIETFVDKNNEADADVLNQAGLETVAEGGRTATSVSVLPSSDLTMSYGRDWYLGDRVTVVVGGQEVSATVTETAITVSSDGIRIGATVGDPSGVDFDALITKRERTTPKRLNAAELKEASGGGGGGGGITEPVDTLQWDTTYTGGSTAPGMVAWNNTDGTLEFKLKGDEVTLQVGQEHVIHVRNQTGSTIADVTAVMFDGSNGANIRVTPAISTASSEPEGFVGITTQAIDDGDFGYVTQFGMINRIDTSAWSDGSLLYVDPTVPGGLTDTKPSAPNWTFPVAAVIKSDATTGKILVRAIPGQHVHDLVDADIGTLSNNDVLAWDSGDSVWKNQSANQAGLIADGSTAGGDLTGTYPSPSLAATGTAGTYTKVTTDTKGRVTSGTTLSASDVPSLDASKITSGTLPVANGGTGASTAATARSNLSAVGVFAQDSEPAGGNIGDIWIDTDSGQNTIGATPRFEGVRTSAQNIGTGAVSPLTFTSIIENVGGFVESSGAVTVPLTGRYSIGARISYSNNTTGRRTLRARINGTDNSWELQVPTTQQNSTSLVVGVPSIRLNAGDYVEAVGVQNSGSTLTIDGGLTIEFLGA